MSNDALIHIRNLRTHLFTSKGVVKAVDGVDLEIRKGEIFGLVGESGCGKTITALSVIRLLPEPPARIVDGTIELDGEDAVKLSENDMRRIRGDKISMIFQDPMTSLNPLMKIGAQVAEVIRIHRKIPRKAAWKEAIEVLRSVGIPEPETRASQFPFELSGGMRQRVMIAVALAARPKLIIADEPTTNLDATIQAQILNLLKSVQDRDGTSILLITHNLGIVAWICDRVGVMYAGRIVEVGPAASVLSSPSHPYTQALLKSVPRVDVEKGHLGMIPGDVPGLINLPQNECHFHNRCVYEKKLCRSSAPYPVQVDQTGEHFASCFMYTKEWEGMGD